MATAACNGTSSINTRSIVAFALSCTIKYPQLFAAGAALSAAVLPDDQMVGMPDENWDHVFAQLYGRGLKGKDRLNKAWQARDILE